MKPLAPDRLQGHHERESANKGVGAIYSRVLMLGSQGTSRGHHTAIKSEEFCLIICLDDDNLVHPYDGQLLLMTAMSTMIKMIKERDFCFCLFTYVSVIASFCLFLSFLL